VPISTIKLISLQCVGDHALELGFSDGSIGLWSAEQILRHETVLTRPLMDPDYFRRAFVEAGALAWPNGLELSAHNLHTQLQEAGGLKQQAA
jgi:hypothetical protein